MGCLRISSLVLPPTSYFWLYNIRWLIVLSPGQSISLFSPLWFCLFPSMNYICFSLTFFTCLNILHNTWCRYHLITKASKLKRVPFLCLPLHTPPYPIVFCHSADTIENRHLNTPQLKRATKKLGPTTCISGFLIVGWKVPTTISQLHLFFPICINWLLKRRDVDLS